MNAPDQVKTEDAFHKLIHENHMYGLWELAGQNTPTPQPECVAHIWKWSLLEKVVKQSTVAVPVGDDRRAMQLFNPGFDRKWATTNTLISAVQVLMPGEIAKAHRHTAAAIRFIMEGDGAYTAVNGEKLVMHKGDLVLTPNWTWHDHGNETDKVIVWQDGLDVPLTKSLNAFFFEMAKEEKMALTRPVLDSVDMYGKARVSPRWVKEYPLYSPMMVYPWEQTKEALHALRDREGSPYEGVALEFTHPHTGGPCLPTMRCQVQLIRPGEKLKARRVTGSSVFNCVQGQGRTVIDGKVFDWTPNDIFCLPSWALHEHHNTGKEDAVLFSYNDHPVLEKFGFFREQALADNGGHQKIS